ncbi:hypothetical protein AMJ87_02540 [candidate division WOR_3 bacterium SM23_60]|uniref:VTT domain-containing protein n=1 Tax=candidate division WOR_3 bacterium SM23_60 TaxID=1703780 RepID=A0A0S8GLI6_UNCW3|nr:MAG: hypothetical protein AMJ87_02540 [candidate division WOR_3 bacterium SM23_60]
MLEWLSTQNPIVVYVFLIFNAIVESIFPPYPSDAFVAVIAFSAGQGYFNPYVVYVMTCAGSVAGMMILYAVAKCRGDVIIRLVSRSFLKKLIPLAMIERAKKKFATRGDIIMIMNRFLPGMRAALCFAAGIAGVRIRKMFFYSLVSVCAWNLFLILISYHIGSSWEEASTFLRSYNTIVIVVLMVLLGIASFAYFKRRKKT